MNDTLKIDRSFVSRMGANNDENLKIVQAIISLAHNLGMEVVAEGVETEQQAAQLKALKCGAAQGFYFSPPLEQEAALALILSQPVWQQDLGSQIKQRRSKKKTKIQKS